MATNSMMRHTVMKNYVLSFATAIIVVILLMVLVRFSLVASILLSPGMLLATHIVPHSTWDGLHISDTGDVEQVGRVSPWRYIYVALFVVLNAMIFSVPMLFLIRKFVSRDRT
jgi:hypothetical protein